MTAVTYSLTTSLDGYTMDAGGSIDWSAPDEESFRLATDEVRGLGGHLLGRRLYEAMLYWDGREEDPALGPLERDFARIWNALPKVVFSRTLTEVRGAHTVLASDDLASEVARLREASDADVAVGGPMLAAAAADLDLIDEYRMRVRPVLLGGGTPFFATHGRRVHLEPLENRPLRSGVVYQRYRVLH